MALVIEVNASTNGTGHYVTYAPSPCTIRQTNGQASLSVILTSRPKNPGGGEVVFFADPTRDSDANLTLTVPSNGSPVDFWIGGKWQTPSVEDKDCLLVANDGASETIVELMVRLRKNANDLNDDERDRFLDALQAVNNGGLGAYQDFREMHVNLAYYEEHSGPQFLPWHRAYLLDLEREMQAVDPSVALHYWRFDEPAPYVFTADFMGATTQVLQGRPGTSVSFTPGHAFAGWTTDTQPGIDRSAYFDTQVDAAPGRTGFEVINQADTLDLGTSFGAFENMEGRPHGAAHSSFGGYISNPHTAVKDPLFFMLHSNVDRLWALWQWSEGRSDPSDPLAYNPGVRVGQRLGDTMWPWNNSMTAPRPNFAPRGVNGLLGSAIVASPGSRPTVSSVIDSTGKVAPADNLGFGYDDVPFES